MNGRGFGSHIKGERIRQISDLRVGDLVLEYSAQFHAENTVLITRHLGDRVYGVFVNPHDWTDRWGTEFCIWGFELCSDSDCCYWAVASPTTACV